MRRRPFQFVARSAGALVALGWASAARAVQRFPPPQFETGHTLPATTAPRADPLWLDVLDIALLAAALGIGAYLVIYRRSRRGVIGLGIAALIYFGFVRGGCICPIGAIQNVALAMGGGGYVLPLVVAAFFLLPLIVTIAFGRIFCAGVCPLGAIQDVVVIKPLRVPVWLDHGLSLLAYLYLGLAVLLAVTGSAFVICQYDPFVGLFRMSGTMVMLLLGAGFLLVGMFIARPYCRWLCPYGVLLSWIAPGAARQPKIDPVGCIQCQLCRDGCPVNAIQMPRTPPTDAATRRADRRRMAGLLVLAPLLVAGGTWLGVWLADAIARVHPRVQLAQRLEAEDAGLVEGRTDASGNFRQRGASREALAGEVQAVHATFAWGTPVLGAFMGLVIAVKLIRHARRPSRDEFVIDQARCLACARCFALCPHHPGNEPLLERWHEANRQGDESAPPRSAVTVSAKGGAA